MKTIVLPAEGSGGPAAGDGAWGDGAPGGGASAGNAPGCPASIPGPQAVTGLILAGGRSRRMGEPKALLPLGGETVLAALVEQLRRRCARVFVVSSRAGREAYGKYPVIVDEADDQGPLMGLCSGLAASPTEINLVAACDIPRLPSPLLDALLGCMSEHDIAFVSLPWRGGDQPLLGAYRRAVLPAVRKLLERGERRIVELFPLARTVRVLVEDDRWYANLNTPGDYREFLTRREQPAAAGCGTPGRSAESTASEDAAEAEMREEAGKAEGAEAPTPARQPPGPGEEEDLAPFVAFEVVRVRSGGAWRAEQPVASEVPCT
ncbi:MAG: molybdenum cofactor guanylyltransferase, partial [Candidatus Eisenbacteria bacterium]|nr:molybdenum cofactor guanylyltransferase [Candidatus Eisenbacteria bacterium]